LLLYENEITSVDILKEKTIKDLTQIGGIKRKLAKEIMKEIRDEERKNEWIGKASSPDKPVSRRLRKKNGHLEASSQIVTGYNLNIDQDPEWEALDEDEITELDSEKQDISAYQHGDYSLYRKEITVSGKKRTVHFFSKEKPDEGTSISLASLSRKSSPISNLES